MGIVEPKLGPACGVAILSKPLKTSIKTRKNKIKNLGYVFKGRFHEIS